MVTPTVNSDLLKQVLETAGPKITGLTLTLDAISADIRTIEKWLLDSGVRFEVSEPVEEEKDSAGGYSRSDLVWHGGKDGKTWRIYYRHHWGNVVLEEDPDGDAYSRLYAGGDRRPLIETPVAVRLKSVEPLSRLVNEIASRIPERLVLPRQLSLFN